MQKKGRGSSTIHVIRGIVHPAFQMAFDEHIIARNPCAFPHIMGHGDISVTMNTYTHVNYDNAKDEMEKLFGK